MKYTRAGETFKYGMSLKPYVTDIVCDKNYSGSWICTHHNEPVESREAHVDSMSPVANHEFVWWCSGHGPEDGYFKDLQTKEKATR